MKILCLYNNPCSLPLFERLREQGHECILHKEPLTLSFVQQHDPDLTVSYTYSRLLSGEIIAALHYNVVNLHTSYLPFGRGVDPNMWSLLEHTPRGVTLHYIDEKVDQGQIIAQELVPLSDPIGATLRSSYDELDAAAQQLFLKAFAYYPFWEDMRKKALGNGTYHNDHQGIALREHISSFDMPVDAFVEAMAAEKRDR